MVTKTLATILINGYLKIEYSPSPFSCLSTRLPLASALYFIKSVEILWILSVISSIH